MLTASISRVIASALEEDLHAGDPLARVLGTNKDGSPKLASGKIIAREELVLSGAEVAAEVFRQVDPAVAVSLKASDGELLQEDAVILEASGNLGSLLTSERVALNFLGRLCGVASYARELTQKAGSLTVLDTRKTTPGLRELEKRAVVHGGGRNHRRSLSDLVMLKSTAIDGSSETLDALIERLRSELPVYTPIEVEVRSVEECSAALLAAPEIIMLDNMDKETIEECCKLRSEKSPSTRLEVSGNITAERFSELSALPIDTVSTSGFSTRSIWKDVSFRVASRNDGA